MTDPMTPEQKGLRLAAALTLGFGLLLALATLPAMNLPIRLIVDLMAWPFDRAQTLSAAETRVGYAIAGGVMAGWGLMIWQLTGEPLQRMPEVVRTIIRTSVLVWFAVDSTGSVLAGVPLNVGGNLVFLALFLFPLRRGARMQVA